MTTPSTKYVTIISDPHGCYESFKALMEQIPWENNRKIIVGDILDRGPDSYSIFAYVREHDIEMILGNHEYLFLERKKGMGAMQLWMMNGGEATLRSVEQQEDSETILQKMETYFRQLPYYINVTRPQADDLLISHAGIEQSLYEHFDRDWKRCFKIDPADSSSFLWTRSKLADIEGKIQIVGHTPMSGIPRWTGNNLYIDSGCVFQRPGLGTMTAMQFDHQSGNEPVEVYQQPNIDYS